MSHSCINRHTNNVTTSARNVHPMLAHKHEDADAIHQLRCQCCFGPCHAKHEANAASVRWYCAPVTGRLAPGRRPISCSPHDWGRDCASLKWWLILLIPVKNGNFSTKNISQGSVATRLRCGGIYNYHCAANLPLSMSVKEFSKSVKKWQSYSHEFGVFLFWDTV